MRLLVVEDDPDLNRQRELWTTYSLRNGRKLDTAWKSRGPRPARQPPAELQFAWSNLWLYVLAPVVGAALAAVMFRVLKAAEAARQA